MKSLKYFSFAVIIIFSFSTCKKNPDSTMTFHITNSTTGGYVIQMTSAYKNDVESTYSGTYDNSITLPGTDNVVASGWSCTVTNSVHQAARISITMTFNNGTPHTVTDSLHYGLQAQGQ